MLSFQDADGQMNQVHQRDITKPDSKSLTEHLGELATTLVAVSNEGKNVFGCPYRHVGDRRLKGGAVARTHLHADIDGPFDLDGLRSAGGMAVASGSTTGGEPHGHLYIRLIESVTSHVHQVLSRAMGQKYGGKHHDASKTTDENLLRPAGTLNWKTKDPQPVVWLIRPDDATVQTWTPEALAGHLGVSWPISEPARSIEPVRSPRSAGGGPTPVRLERAIATVTEAPAGEGNKVLNWAAGIAGALCVADEDAPNEEDVWADLEAAYLSRPLRNGQTVQSKKGKAHRTIESGWTWGTQNPAKALNQSGHGGADGFSIEAYDSRTLGPGSTSPHGGTTSPRSITQTEGQSTVPTGTRRQLHFTKASDIAPRPITHLWEDRLAQGTLGIVAGEAGRGKSTLVYALVAAITLGTLEGNSFGTPRNVLVSATEESLSQTIVPRLMAAGADLSRVYRVEVDTDGLMGELSLPSDVDAITEAVGQSGARLLILDPLMSRLSGRLDTHKDAEVRQALEPVVRAADELGVALLGLMHHNKSGSTDPLQLVMGSKAFTALARSVHTVIPDPDDEAVKLFGTPKNNLGRTDLPTLSYRIEEVRLGEDRGIDPAEGVIAVGAVRWGEDRDESIGEAMRAEAAKGRGKGKAAKAMEAAQVWLWDHLLTNGGAVVASEAQAAGEEDGHAERTMQRAAKQMKEQGHLHIVREGFPARSMWKLARVQNGENDDRDNLARLDGGEK